MLDVYIKKTLLLIETALDNYFPKTPGIATKVHESMKYTLFSGGKRIRPLLMTLVAESFNNAVSKVYPFACAVEFVHTSSLILDDLPCMDNAALRRNKPANHLVYGEDIAILAAIGLLNHAYSIIANEINNVAHEKILHILDLLTDAISINGLVGGQSLDLLSKDKNIELTMLHYIHQHKTASLFIAATDISALLSNASNQERAAIREYSKAIGLAFQISDDLNDLLYTEKELGKDTKKDIKSTTYVSFYGVTGACNMVNELTEKAKHAISALIHNTELLIQLADTLKRKESCHL
ncbi:MAG: hypothetical protein A2Y62_06795 [Candidatus Fischerbacteria bacterium RBG_13_37_8]|uniref:Polyprenyl synthetase n=1 Tax=Candidatus Fischerbacteria bacterium RBG_13_37_8 TaxID=1817863 RepID=A0A1F5VM99_9BACT|nr:MAG: hypothetical protein A2Y62_06795 [Candidatus Fischerbacteria bacterium RBG_13_37_8]